MINFILPNFYDDFKDNQEIIENTILTNNICGIGGGFPFSIFRGKINNNKQGSLVVYDDMKKIVEDYKEIGNNLVLIDCGNLLLKDFDYSDAFNSILFELYSNSNNVYFEIADEKLIQYMINLYPNIQITLHENYTIFHKEEDIQDLIQKYPNNIKNINITLLNLCHNIKIDKIGILNLDSCYYCAHFPLCLKLEHKQILRYQAASQFNECQNKKIITLDSLINNLKILLKETNNIMFSEIALDQRQNYIDLINKIFQEEQKGTF